MRRCFGFSAILVINWVVWGGSQSATAASMSFNSTRLGSAKVVYVGQGKGTALGWDLGLLQAAFQAMPAFENGEVVLAANSGTAFLGAYFACRGFTSESIREAEVVLKDFDPRLVNEDPTAKLATVIVKYLMVKDHSKRGLEKLVTTFEHSNLENSLRTVLLDGKCVPRLPLILYAGNAQILDNRDSQSTLMDLFRNRFDGKDEKTIDYRDFTVHSPSGKLLGKSCTYFVTLDLFQLLERIPWTERVCDLRPIRNADDLRLAVLASVSEPTYFPWTKEPSPELISGFLSPDLEKDGRFYNGGFTNSAVMQDLRRVLPQVVAIGSGRPAYPDMHRGVVRGLYAVRLAEIIPYGKWWLDLEIPPTEAIWRETPKLHPDINAWLELNISAGRSRALDCFYRADDCLPGPVTRPTFAYALGDLTKTPLVTQRGRKVLSGLLRDRPQK